MNALIMEAINVARSVRLDRNFAQQLFEENQEGTRITGIAVAQARPYPEHVDLATKIIQNSRSPFEQFHALLLARAVVDRASPEQREALRNALLNQAGTPIDQSDSSRADIKAELLNKIDTETPAPQLVTISAPVVVSYNDNPHEHHGEFVITRGQHELKPPSEFRIGCYPVTNQLFLRFLNDHGYEEDRYWREDWRRDFLTKNGKTRGPATWESSGAYPAGCGNHPVSGISYVEATAFVQWLQLRYPEPGWSWCIPSEDMWELTARSPEGYRYPWGHTFETGYCNSVEAGVAGPSDVAQFPLGKSAYGCSDMAGNVWEFVEPADTSYWTCVLRGGSYRNNQYQIMSCFRLVQVSVNNREPDFGLRCAQVRNAEPVRP
jgi:formylglycine-generating enzyme required for sulfatase activity